MKVLLPYALGHADPRTTERYQYRKLNLDNNAVDVLQLLAFWSIQPRKVKLLSFSQSCLLDVLEKAAGGGYTCDGLKIRLVSWTGLYLLQEIYLPFMILWVKALFKLLEDKNKKISFIMQNMQERMKR